MRPLTRLLALVLALALIVAGAIAAIELAAAAGNSHDVIVPYQHWWRSTNVAHWNTGWVTLTALIACAGGILLLATQLGRQRTSEIALRTRRPDVEASVERRALERSMREALNDIDGVGRNRVRIRNERARVAVHADGLCEPGLAGRVGDAAQERLDGLELAQPLRLNVRITPRAAKR